MPPDMNKLPEPGDSFEISEEEYKDDVKDLLKIKDNNPKNFGNESDLLNNMKKKIQ